MERSVDACALGFIRHCINFSTVCFKIRVTVIWKFDRRIRDGWNSCDPRAKRVYGSCLPTALLLSMGVGIRGGGITT